jgi:hypothetical protein
LVIVILPVAPFPVQAQADPVVISDPTHCWPRAGSHSYQSATIR